MTASNSLVLGCATPTCGRLLALRNCILQIKSQTMRPQHHAIFSYASESFDLRFINDLMDTGIAFRHSSLANTSLSAATEALKMLRDRNVDLYFWIVAEHIYRTGYVAAIVKELQAPTFDLQNELVCIGLTHQERVAVAENGRETPEPLNVVRAKASAQPTDIRSFQGIGPTLVFNRKSVDLLIDAAGKNKTRVAPEVFWLETLQAAGARLSPVRTSRPVFGLVGKASPAPTAAPAAAIRHPPPARKQRKGNPDVSVVIPTYNEGDWLRKTVDSVLEAETEASIEIIVVDDGCSDGSVDAIQDYPDVKILKNDAPQSGLIIGKNLGGRKALGKYVCFLDSHILVGQRWLDHLRETFDAQKGPSLITGLILDIDKPYDPAAPLHYYGYSFKDWTLNIRWHHYRTGKESPAYPAPLCPGGLMFTRRDHFARLGGFFPVLRKWGHEDAEISLKNYYLGGENLVDPRVVVRHYYKNNKDKKPSFQVSYKQTFFNALIMAKTYFPPATFAKVKEALAAKGKIDDILPELESAETIDAIKEAQDGFVRGFDDWTNRFRKELKFMFEEPNPSSADGTKS